MESVGVIKQNANRDIEQFDPLKLHASIVAACLSVGSFEGHAHDTAQRVCETVLKWCVNKHEITSSDIRRQASTALSAHHPEAAYFYNHHRVIM